MCINSAARRANHALYGWKRQGHEPSFTWERYQAMLSKQGGRCAICRQRPEDCQTQGRKRLDADHDHVTGKVRGLLCNPCNGAVALFEKGTLRRPDLIERVRDYLGLDREQAA